MKRPYSLHKRLALFYLIPFSLLLALLCGYIISGNLAAMEQAESTFYTMATTQQDRLQSKLQQARRTTLDFAYSSQIQRYLQESDQISRYNLYPAVRESMQAQLSSNDFLSDAYVLTSTGRTINAVAGLQYVFTLIERKYDVFTELQSRQSFFTKPLTVSNNSSSSSSLYCAYYYSALPLYSAPIQFYSAVLINLTELLNQNKNDVCEELLLDGNDVLFSSLSLSENDIQQITASEGLSTVKLNNVPYFISMETLMNDTNLHYVYLVPQKALIGVLEPFSDFAIWAILLAVLLLSASLVGILRSIWGPIQQITDNVAHITPGTTSAIPESNARELCQLTQTINTMLQRNQEYNNRERKLQEAIYQGKVQQSRAELLAYRNQINPHFLFNTLECLSAMAHYYHVDDISDLITNFSDSCRYSMRAPLMVPLKDELAHIQNYWAIIEARFPGRFVFRQTVSDDAKEIAVPSLLLQPMIENAVSHAFENYTKKARSTIVLRAWIDHEKSRLHIDCIDNGMGMNDARFQQVLSDMRSDDIIVSHIGLNNLYHRLKLTYQQDCMQITTREGVFTRIELNLPLKTVESNQPK